MSTQNERTETIATLEKEFSDASGIFMTDFTAITVEKMTQFRANLRKAGIKYLVVKNSLAEKAFERTNFSTLIPFLKGPTGLAITKGDGVAPAKVIKEFKKENKNLLTVKAAVVDGALFNADDALKLSDLPSKEVLLSQLLSCWSAPMSNFVGTLQSILSKFAATLDEVKKQKESNQSNQG
ncbi:MAG: 50S ribosomal protein L10 [Chitinivibrionales bacterium]|nr:50S ribosomal protein L10 [Chitinivibrionales bacterium]